MIETPLCVGDRVRISNGGGLGEIVRGPCFLIKNDNGGRPQFEDASNLRLENDDAIKWQNEIPHMNKIKKRTQEIVDGRADKTIDGNATSKWGEDEKPGIAQVVGGVEVPNPEAPLTANYVSDAFLAFSVYQLAMQKAFPEEGYTSSWDELAIEERNAWDAAIAAVHEMVSRQHQSKKEASEIVIAPTVGTSPPAKAPESRGSITQAVKAPNITVAVGCKGDPEELCFEWWTGIHGITLYATPTVVLRKDGSDFVEDPAPHVVQNWLKEAGLLGQRRAVEASLSLNHREVELIREFVIGDLRGLRREEFSVLFKQRLEPFVIAKWDVEEEIDTAQKVLEGVHTTLVSVIKKQRQSEVPRPNAICDHAEESRIQITSKTWWCRICGTLCDEGMITGPEWWPDECAEQRNALATPGKLLGRDRPASCTEHGPDDWYVQCAACEIDPCHAAGATPRTCGSAGCDECYGRSSAPCKSLTQQRRSEATPLDIAVRALRSIARDGDDPEAQGAANALAEIDRCRAAATAPEVGQVEDFTIRALGLLREFVACTEMDEEAADTESGLYVAIKSVDVLFDEWNTKFAEAADQRRAAAKTGGET